jgi:hypothetical protein
MPVSACVLVQRDREGPEIFWRGAFLRHHQTHQGMSVTKINTSFLLACGLLREREVCRAGKFSNSKSIVECI